MCAGKSDITGLFASRLSNSYSHCGSRPRGSNWQMISQPIEQNGPCVLVSFIPFLSPSAYNKKESPRLTRGIPWLRLPWLLWGTTWGTQRSPPQHLAPPAPVLDTCNRLSPPYQQQPQVVNERTRALNLGAHDGDDGGSGNSGAIL